MKYKTLRNYLNGKYPERSAEEWDNVGTLYGEGQQPIDTVVVALDLTSDVLEKAISSGAHAIVTHHPFIFGSETIKEETKKNPYKVRMNRRIINTGMCVYAMHTNYDRKQMAAQFASALGFKKYTNLKGSKYAIVIERSMQMETFKTLLKKRLNISITLSSKGSKTTGKIAIFPGAGGNIEDFIVAKKQGVKTVVVSDIKWNETLFLKEEGMQVIIIPHKAEDVFVNHVKDQLANKFTDINVIGIIEDEVVTND